ncbi:GEL complex subunit OPTI-like [Dysidea avara]|uniref:GEL complex subunit OPTI-like n=1 Tax=Dysidea avara TaxID=196820 RepID=UPI00332E21D6
MQKKVKTARPPSFISIVIKAIRPRQTWDDKDQFMDVIHWLRQLLAVILGFVWGVLPLHGIVGLLLFLAINGVGIYLYATVYQAQDEEDYGGAWDVFKEGMLTSSAFFVVNWILWYTACNYG